MPNFGDSLRDLFRRELDEHQMVLEFHEPVDSFLNAIQITIRRQAWGEISHQWKTIIWCQVLSLELHTEREMMGRLAETIARMIELVALQGSHELEDLLDKWILHDDLANVCKGLIIDWRPQESLPEDYYN